MHEAPVNVPSRFIDFIDVLPISDAASAAAPSAPMRFSAPEKHTRMRSTQEHVVPRVVATKATQFNQQPNKSNPRMLHGPARMRTRVNTAHAELDSTKTVKNKN